MTEQNQAPPPRVYRGKEIEDVIQTFGLTLAGIEADEGLVNQGVFVEAEILREQLIPASPSPDWIPEYDLIGHIVRQKAFSEKAFGPGERIEGLMDHIRKELVEIEENPNDIEEWADLILLALDGAWRQRYSAVDIARAIESKLAKNERREWPDWRTAEPGKAIEHVRPAQIPAAPGRDE